MDFSLLHTSSKHRPDPSAALVTLRDVVASDNMILFEDTYLYLQKEFIRLPLLLVVPQQGLILFEPISWSIDTLQGSSISAWHPSSKQPKSINVNDPIDFIRQKFNYILHQDLTITTAMILFEQLSSKAFDQLDHSFQDLIPKSRALFQDETTNSLRTKITAALAPHTLTFNTTTLVSTLFVQYTLLPDHFNALVAIANAEQQHYVDADFLPRSSVIGPYGSGKSTMMLLKVLTYLLRHPKQHVMIIVPSLSACDLLKQKMLDIMEYAIMDMDISNIEIITPKILLARHAQRLYHKPIHPITITEKMLRKPFHVADIMICDDADLLPKQFITYLQHLQQKQTLHLLCTHKNSAIGECMTLTTSYRLHTQLATLCLKDLNDPHSYENIANIKFWSGNIYMQTILAFNEMLKVKQHGETSLIITPNRTFSQMLYEQMCDYVEEEIVHFNAQESMIDTLFEHHIIVEQNVMASLYKEHVIVVGIHPQNKAIFCHALSRGYKSIHIVLHNDSNDSINLTCEEYL